MSDESTEPSTAAADTQGGSVTPAPMGVTAIFGHSRLGPLRTAVWCERERDYNNAFGDFADGHTLAAAVRGFFENGGRRCVVFNLGERGPGVAPGDLGRLDDLAEVELVCAPGQSEPAQHEVLARYASGRGDVLALLDGPPDLARRMATYYPARLDNAALYVPWVRVHDPAAATELDAPPSGHMAGLFARVAYDRGIHKAPANEPLHGLTGLSLDIGLPQQDLLYPRGMNCIRQLPNLEGLRPWGAQTLGEREPFRTIASWRVFGHVVRSLRTGCRWLLGRSSEPETWQQVRLASERFLHNIWQDGGLAGGREEDAYRVRCDAALNSPERREKGQVLLEIGLALQKSGAFFNFQLALDLVPA